MIQEQYSRISHHTSSATGTTGIPFSVPATEDFTNGSWTPFDLALSEIGVDEFQEKVFIRIGNNIKEICTDCNTTGSTGTGTTSSGDYSFAIGSATTSSGNFSFAGGINSVAGSGTTSFAFGSNVTATTDSSAAFGKNTLASGLSSFAIGEETKATGLYSYSEGYLTTASGQAAHAEGRATIASGLNSHAEGENTTAAAQFTHAGGSEAKSLIAGEWSRSSNTTGQYGIICLGGITPSNTPTVLTASNGSTDEFSIPIDTAYRVEVTVVAINNNNSDAKEWTGSFLIKRNNAGTTAFVGAPAGLVSTFGDASLATAVAACTADDTNDVLRVTVTGVVVLTVNWFVKMEYTQVRL
jgi:hypothetical protein